MTKKKSKKKKYIIIAIILIVILGLYFWIRSSATNTLNDFAQSSIIESIVTREKIEVQTTQNGVIEPNKKNEIFAPMGGTVTKQYNVIGDNVAKDETIFKIGGYNIKSPIKGEIIWTNFKEDDYVSTTSSTGMQTPIAIVADMSKLKFNIEIDELEINKVVLGMNVEVTADAIPNQVFLGKVNKINKEGTNVNGVTTYTVEVVIEEYGDLKIGMNVDATLILESKEDTLVIPMTAINKQGAETYVYVKDDSINDSQKITTIPKTMADLQGYKKQLVTVGISNKDNIEILSGLNEGDKVYNISSSKSLTEYMLEQGTSGGMSVSVSE